MFLDVNDEFSGNIAPAGRLTFDLPRISVRELIHERVRMELERLFDFRTAGPVTLQPSQAERQLNEAPRPSPLTGVLLEDDTFAPHRPTAKQLDAAEQAFLANRFFILLDDRQAESLDELIDLQRTSDVTFLLLTPLKGG